MTSGSSSGARAGTGVCKIGGHLGSVSLATTGASRKIKCNKPPDAVLRRISRVITFEGEVAAHMEYASTHTVAAGSSCFSMEAEE